MERNFDERIAPELSAALLGSTPGSDDDAENNADFFRFPF